MSLLGSLPKNENLAIFTPNQTVTYSELHRLIEEKLKVLTYVQSQEVVWMECRNTIETMVHFLACWHKKACVVPIDPQLGETEISYLFSQIPPHHILTETNTSKINGKGLTTVKNPDVKDAQIVQLSSGTTGTPKIMLISGEAIRYRAVSNRDHLGLTAHEKTLCTVPLSHSHGIDCLALPTLFAGGSLYLFDPTTAYPYRILDWIEKYQITFFSSLPQMYDQFNKLFGQKKYKLDSLRYPFCGSAALAESTAVDFNKNFHLHLRQGYGLAEIGVICVNIKSNQDNYHSIGEVIKGIEWKLADDGELLVKAPSLFSGYYRNESETKNRLEQGFLKTEDLITIDKDGFFYITGRKNDVINIMGKKVFPKEIEGALAALKSLKEYCITSASDHDRGQIAVLHAVRNDAAVSTESIEKEILAYLSGKLEDFKIPRKFVWHDHLPKSPLGKILKSKLL